MSNMKPGTDVQSDDVLEHLLKHASPRPVPSQSDEALVRQAVRAEWRSMSSRYRSRRRIVSYALAATVLLGVFAVFNALRTPLVEVVQVATIEKSFGSISLLSEHAGLRKTQDLSNVLLGQTIVTGKNSGMALAWGNGGSMRMDENTRVEFRSDTLVYLLSGRVYFDSRPSPLIAGTGAAAGRDFVVRTDHGDVEHVGTQFMAGVADDMLTVSVREGTVSVDGVYHDAVVAASGQQIKLDGRRPPIRVGIPVFGDSWNWVGQTSPSADVNQRLIHDFLQWVCRETGLTLVYEGQAEQIAKEENLNGVIETEPMKALSSWMVTTGLDWNIDNEGVLHISDNR